MGTQQTARLGGVMGVWEAAARLEAMARELREGSLTLACGRASLALSPAVMLDVEIKATKQADREGVDVRLSWRPPQPYESGARGEF
jgi:amphi-Trp domain-containing protein